jgi:hypothetical protein
MTFFARFPSPAAKCERDVAACAASAVEAIVEAGAGLLIAEPWRVARIIHGADRLTFEDLAAEIARRRAQPPPADFNRALALAQLARAVERPAFAATWARRASNANIVAAGKSGRAGCGLTPPADAPRATLQAHRIPRR